jgi:Flp pilus assembly protein TadD
LRRACEARHRQLPLELSSVMAWRQELERDPPAAPLAALTWAALGLLYAAFRRLPETRACHEQCTRLGGPHPELSLALARLMLAGGHPAQAEPLLESAARDDKTRTAALQHRAQALGMQGRHEPALAAIDEVCERTPAWSEPLRLRARALQALGRDDEARRAAAQAQALDNAVRQVMLGLRGG